MVKCDQGVVEIEGKAKEVMVEICVLIMNFKTKVLMDARKKCIEEMTEDYINKELQKCIDSPTLMDYTLKELVSSSKGICTQDLIDTIKSLFSDNEIKADEDEDEEDDDDFWDDDDEEEEDED